jgi:hypothetical protein
MMRAEAAAGEVGPLRGASAQACVSGMFELKDDSAFKGHLRDFLVQTKSFADKNNADLFAEEAAAQREVPLLGFIGFISSAAVGTA